MTGVKNKRGADFGAEAKGMTGSLPVILFGQPWMDGLLVAKHIAIVKESALKQTKARSSY